MKKLTYEFVKSYIESFEEYKLISEEYINTKTKLKIKHLKCGTEYEVTFSDFKGGNRCPYCSKKEAAKKRKLLYEQVRDYINSVKSYKLISKEYVNCKTKLIVRHLECGTKYEVTFSDFRSGKRCPFCFGVQKAKLLGVVGQPLYDYHADKISFCEDIRRDPENYYILQVRCKNSNCRKWFTPTLNQIHNRISVLNNKKSGEHNFYCSEKCKHSCSIFWQQTYPKDHKPYKDNLERDLYWRQLVLERDKYECQICGSTEKLEAHHIDSINTNPIMSADLENGITLCEACHKRAHKDVGCRYIDLKKENICKEVK